jgi:hypothetical protein
MTQARSTTSHFGVMDVTSARIDGSSVAPGAAASRLPPGYEAIDLHVLEWIAAHRYGRRPLATLAA